MVLGVLGNEKGLKMKEYKDFQAHNGLYEHNQRMDGEQWRFKFDNGYGASVITGGYCLLQRGATLRVGRIKT